jgi:hypothetical protein
MNAAGQAAGVCAYQLLVTLRGISPLVWRRLLVRSDTTIAQVHDLLQIAMGWADEHLHQFRIHGKAYGVYRGAGFTFARVVSARRKPSLVTTARWSAGSRASSTTSGTAIRPGPSRASIGSRRIWSAGAVMTRDASGASQIVTKRPRCSSTCRNWPPTCRTTRARS